MTNNARITIRIPEKVLNLVKAEGERAGNSVASVIKRILADYYAEETKKA